MARKKILILENSIHITGALNTVLRTSLELKREFDFVFVLPKGSKASQAVEQRGFPVFEIPMLELSKRWQSIVFYIPNLIRSAYLLRRIAREQNVDVIHVNDFYNLVMPLWRFFGGRIKYLCYVNFVPDRFPWILRKLWINSHLLFTSRIVTVSQYVLKQLPNRKKIVCIPCALPTQHFVDIDTEKFDKGKIILFVGNFMEGKGQDLAVRSFAALAKSFPEWKLRFVGSDMGLRKNELYVMSLKNLAITLHMESQIEWRDFTDNVSHEYQTSSIALNFSRSESFSLTVQEAMLYGCPIIATRSGGPAEMIETMYSGILVPVDGIKEMSEAMIFLISNPDERERLRANANKSIQEKFNSEKTIEPLYVIYNTLA